MTQLTLPQLRTLIDKADAAYFGGQAVMTDAAYDDLKAALRRLAPDDERFARVGDPWRPEDMGNKVQHAIPMGSLDNVDDGIAGYPAWNDWLAAKLDLSAPPEIMGSLKIDGSSIALSYQGGRLTRAVTRGNGEVGEDVTRNAARFRGVPTALPAPLTIEVRGEAVLPAAAFQALRGHLPPDELSNSRNVGNGIVGRHDGTDAERIEFYAFNCWRPDGFPDEGAKFAFLEAVGFTPAPHRLCADVAAFQAWYDEVIAGRAALTYEIDGLVAAVNDCRLQERFVTADPKSRLRPKWARAVKPPHKSAVTVVEGVEVTVGHTGSIIPTAKLRRVRIGGVWVDSALLTNYEEVKRLDVAIGDHVEVILAGDIIPKIMIKVADGDPRTPIVEPAACPACGAPTTRVHRGRPGAVTYCTDAACPGAALMRLHHWIGSSKKGVGILDLGDAMILALWKLGKLREPADLYRLRPEDLEDVVLESGGRIGRSPAERVVANVAEKRTIPLSTFLGALGVDLLGRRRVVLLAKAAGGQLDRLDDWLDAEKLRTIQVEGLGDVTRKALIEGIDDCRDVIARLLAAGVVAEPLANAPAPAAKGPVAGRSFCWTGTRAGVPEVEAAGGVVRSSVSKGLDFLVVKDRASASAKARKAEALGTQVIDVGRLFEVLAGRAAL